MHLGAQNIQSMVSVYMPHVVPAQEFLSGVHVLFSQSSWALGMIKLAHVQLPTLLGLPSPNAIDLVS